MGKMSIRCGTVFAAVVCLATPAYAGVIEWQATTGDWFDPANWDAGRVPEPLGGGGAGDSAAINNGGTAQANSATAPAPVVARNIHVGAQTSGATRAGAVAGALHSQGVAVEGQFRVDVGVASGAVTSADGTLTVEDGGLSAGQTVNVGSVATPEAPATANGVLTVGGDVTPASALNVGTVAVNTFAAPTTREATASGRAVIGGDVSGSLGVGTNAGGATTSLAHGEVTIGGGLELRSFGVSVGTANTGLADDGGMGTGAISVGGDLTLSPNPTFTSMAVGRASGPSTVADGSLEVAGSILFGVGQVRGVEIGSAALDGSATGVFIAGGGDLRVDEDLLVGAARGGFDIDRGAGMGTGLLDLGGGTITATGDPGGQFGVGYIQNSGLFSTGEGTAEGELRAGGVAGFDNYFIGANIGTRHAAGSLARGEVTLGAGGLAGIADGSSNLFVGVSSGQPNNGQLFGPGGVVEGSLRVDGGSIGTMNSIAVGSSASAFGFGSGMGRAVGSLVLDDGSASADTLRVGHALYRHTVQSINPDAMPSGEGVFEMRNGTLELADGFSVGEVFTLQSNDGIPDSTNLVAASGIARLTDVVVAGDALTTVGGSFGFDVGPSAVNGELHVLRGAVSLGLLRIGVAPGEEDVANGRVTLADTSLTTSDSVFVGFGGAAEAMLRATDTDVSVGGDLLVSSLRSVVGTDEVPALNGLFEMSDGTLDVAGRLQVGAGFTGGNGTMRLRNVDATADGRLDLASSFNTGTIFGNGVLELEDSTLAVGGAAKLDAGELTLVRSRMSVAGDLVTTFRDASTGEYFDDTSGDAVISLSRSLLEVGGEFGHSVDDLLHIALDGALRGTEYGAIDAGTVALRGGLLAVDVNFALTAQQYVFDLVLSSFLDGIVGDFADFTVSGLDPLYTATGGVVIDDFGSGGVEVWRLALERRVVAEPGPVALLALGLCVLALRHRRRPRQGRCGTR